MRLRVVLTLSRISLLPTVWSNTMAGVALAGGSWRDFRIAPLLICLSLFYVGGMWLNDAFDHGFDERTRPERPIPSGAIRAGLVFAWGFAMIGIGWLGLAGMGLWLPGGPMWIPALSGSALAGSIVAYDAWHKGNPLGPVWMGCCRMLVVLTAALSITGVASGSVVRGAIALLAYIIGLTYCAKTHHFNRVETIWPLGFLVLPILLGGTFISRAPLTLVPLTVFTVWMVWSLLALVQGSEAARTLGVMRLLAGISLLDAVLIASTRQPILFIFSVMSFFLTLRLQRWIPGT